MLSATGKSRSSSGHRRRRHRYKSTTRASSAPRVKVREPETSEDANTPSPTGYTSRKETPHRSVSKRYVGQGRRPKSASGIPSSRTKSKPTVKERPVSSASPRVNGSKPAEETTKPETAPKEKRSSGFMDALFGNRNADRKNEKKVTCITCLADDIPLSKSAKLSCSHRMCYGCLKRIFTMSVSDPQHMPPRCCTSDHIPLKHVDRLFDSKFKTQWNKKYQEYMTQNRLYCPARGCGEWIRPNNIHQDLASANRRYGKCPKCKTKICTKCNRKWHRAKDCPQDEGTQRFAEIAEQEGWQKCFNCSAMVELKEGCNHMTCRCTAEFCMLCGKKWKTCDCPWFNYENMDGDVLNQMNIPDARRNQLRRQMEIEIRQQQERLDEQIARDLQRGLSFEDRRHNTDVLPGAFHEVNFEDIFPTRTATTAAGGSRDGITNAARPSLIQRQSPRPHRNRPSSPIQHDTGAPEENARDSASPPARSRRSSQRNLSILSPFSDEQPARRRRRHRDGI